MWRNGRIRGHGPPDQGAGGGRGGNGEPDRPATQPAKGRGHGSRLIAARVWRCRRPVPRLRARGPCGKDRPPCSGLFWPSPVSGARCRSSVVEHSIGNGEVDSSILSGSTIHLIEIIVVYTDDFLK